MATLLGPDGRPIRGQDLTREIAVPSTTGVRQILSHHPSRGLTPARLSGLLRDAEQGDTTAYLELAEDMEEKDLHYAAVLGTRKRAVAQLDLTVEAASDDAPDEADAELVRQALQREEIEDELFEILDALGKGYSVVEIVWQTSERQWMPLRLEWRDPRWFELDREDGRTLRLRGDAGPEPLPPFKFIDHLPKVKSGLPIRGGLARAAAWCWLFKNYTVKDWVQFAEVHGQPIRIGKFHAGATAEEKETLLRAVSRLGTDAAAIIPDTMLIELLEAERGSSADLYEKLCDWLDRQVSKAVLGQTLTTEVRGGSYAAAQVHDHVRRDIERADAKQLAATLNRCLVRPLIDLNRGPREWYPKILIGRPESADSDALSQALERLVPLGLRVGQAEIRRKLGLREPDEADELLGAGPEPAATETAAACPVHGRAAHARAAAERDAVDDIALRAGELGVELEGAMIEAIRRLLDGATTLQEVADGLLALPGVERERLADLMRRAMVVAELTGRAEIIGRA